MAEAVRGLDLSDPDAAWGLKDVIAECLGSMSGTMQTIAADVGGGSSVMTEHFNEINDSISALSGAAMQTLTLLSGDEEPDILSDDSDSDLEGAVVFGKVQDCTNSGAVNGDSNVGGIAGSISVENELDPEGNLDLSHSRLTKNRLSMRAVLRVFRFAFTFVSS